MIKELVFVDKIEGMKKQRNKLIFVSLAFLCVVIGFQVGSIFIQNRDTMKIFIVINSIISIITLFVLLFVGIEYIIPLFKNIGVYELALSSSHRLETYSLLEIQNNSETYMGIESNVVYFGKDNKKSKYFYPLDEKIKLEIGKEYEIVTYRHLVISIKEVTHE